MSVAERRARVVAAMRDDSIDVLVLGREANARYVSGADRLWLSGTRPFAPGCVLPAATGEVHLLSVTDDGLPADVGLDHLYPISWNPANVLAALAAIPGVEGATRIGVDAMTPFFDGVFAAAFPDAELVDAEALLRGLRRVKDADEIEAIALAVAAAEDALARTCDELRPGVRELDLKAAFEDHMAHGHLTTPAFEATFTVADGNAPRAFVSDRAVKDGDRVHVRAGVLRNGFEGLVTRTLECDGTPVRAPGLASAVARCAAGARVGDLRADGLGIEGTGLGHEELGDDDTLVAGMTLAVEVFDGAVLDGAVVHVTGHGPEVLDFKHT